MPLHRLTGITIGVPNVIETAAYYADFGLTRTGAAAGGQAVTFATADGGDQLTLAAAPRRRLLDIGVGVDDPDDLDRIAVSVGALGLPVTRTAASLHVTDPGTGVRATVEIASRLRQKPVPSPGHNGPGAIVRTTQRAPGVLRDRPVRPRKLGHVVVGSTDAESSHRFFTEGIGFKVSDRIPGVAAFMRCSTDHHNLMIQQAPVTMLHHTSWQVDDVDEIGRGAKTLLEKDPGRHVWGLGRHHIGSNFFWYFKDPAGNFSEYYSDMDCIVEDALWTAGDWTDSRALFSWGPPPPPSFIEPEDLAGLMTSAHGMASAHGSAGPSRQEG
ncbi:dioxygenase [Trebonia kvetii]|uniref:Dioxygenase n=1 Tax=Trebonia kvetii TaxID=2480626 RepID=A0A6P2BNN6_9ACTN|nr:VOC family protein [Trebonia kvetii]TVY99815.1 dioxygenase [Trebonia kvetii]